MARTAQLLSDIQTYMNDARELCERGAFMELQGLDDKVQEICTSIQEMEPEEAVKYAGELDKLMASLTELQHLFEAKRAALGDELNDTNRHHKAAKAYTQSDMSAPKQED